MIEEQEIDNSAFIAMLAKKTNAKALMEATAPELQNKKQAPKQTQEEYYDDYDVKDEPEYQHQRPAQVQQQYVNESQYQAEEVYEEQATNNTPKIQETYIDDDGLEKIKLDEKSFVNDVAANNEIYSLEEKQLRERLERSGLPQAVIEATLKHKVPPIDTAFVQSIQGGATSNVIKERFGKKILSENKDIKKPSVALTNEVKQVQQVNRPQTAQPKIFNPQSIGIGKEEIRQILREELSNIFQGKIILDIDEEVRIAVGEDIYKAKLGYVGKRKKK